MRNVLEYLEASAAKSPDKTAVIDENGSISYENLRTVCQSVGSGLAGLIQLGNPVAVLMEKGIPALTAFYGTVYAGGFYALLNPELPVHRLKQIQSVLQATYVITDAQHFDLACALFQERSVLRIEALTLAAVLPDRLKQVRSEMIDTDPLYANFTSGSTGTPKGVMIAHRSVIDFIDVFADRFAFHDSDIFANQAPFDFDVSVKDIYTAAKVGGTLVIVPRQLFTHPKELLDWLCDHQVTTMIWAVSALCLISTFHGLDYRIPETVRHVLFSGEVMPEKHLRAWMEHLPSAQFVNLYGPTEITCNCTFHVIDPARAYPQGIPIGKPFPNERVFLLNSENQKIALPDTVGEICVEGTALALGYCRSPQQTEAAFVQNPLNSCYPSRIYRTGDLAKYTQAGELMFCGRKDFQIKYMGHRIELEEIERAISDIPGIERCCCLFDAHKEKLYGFYTGTLDRKELRRQLNDCLPIYMVPRMLFQVTEFPLTKNGKIDRKRLMEEKIHHE